MKVLIGINIFLIVVAIFVNIVDFEELTPLLIGLLILNIALTCLWGYSEKESQVQASLINKQYGTEYTPEELFYAADEVNQIILAESIRSIK